VTVTRRLRCGFAGAGEIGGVGRRQSAAPRRFRRQRRIYGKLAVKTRGGATLFAIEHGLCDVSIRFDWAPVRS
jgi:hypothetical protein